MKLRRSGRQLRSGAGHQGHRALAHTGGSSGRELRPEVQSRAGHRGHLHISTGPWAREWTGVIKGGFSCTVPIQGGFMTSASLSRPPSEAPRRRCRLRAADSPPETTARGALRPGPPGAFKKGSPGLRLNQSASRPKTGRRSPTNRKGRLPPGGRPAPVSGEAGLGSVGPGRHGAVAPADRAPPPASCFQTCPVPRKGDRVPRPPPSPVDGSVRPERSGACIDTRCAALLQREPPQPRHPASLSRRPPSGGRRTQRGRVPATQAVRRKPRG